MIAAVESEAITPRPVLDPREPPPQILKDVFKRFQKLPPGDIDADLAILDFNREGLSHGVEQTGAIEPEVLSRVYQKFMGDGYDDCEEQPIYSSKSLPGKTISIYLLH